MDGTLDRASGQSQIRCNGIDGWPAASGCVWPIFEIKIYHFIPMRELFVFINGLKVPLPYTRICEPEEQFIPRLLLVLAGWGCPEVFRRFLWPCWAEKHTGVLDVGQCACNVYNHSTTVSASAFLAVRVIIALEVGKQGYVSFLKFRSWDGLHFFTQRLLSFRFIPNYCNDAYPSSICQGFTIFPHFPCTYCTPNVRHCLVE